jgi:hypothetical protein
VGIESVVPDNEHFAGLYDVGALLFDVGALLGVETIIRRRGISIIGGAGRS